VNVFHEVYTECLSVCLSEHDSCGGDVPVDVSCFLCHKIAVLGKTVKWTAEMRYTLGPYSMKDCNK
jgi:hypothetical protein